MSLPQQADSFQDFYSHKTTSSSGGDSVRYEQQHRSSAGAAGTTQAGPSSSSNGLADYSGRNSLGLSSSIAANNTPPSQPYIPNWSDIFPPPPPLDPPVLLGPVAMMGHSSVSINSQVDVLQDGVSPPQSPRNVQRSRQVIKKIPLYPLTTYIS